MTEHHRYRRVGIIGAGRVAQAIGLGLAPHSVSPVLVWARRPEAAAEAVVRIGRAEAADGAAALVGACDLIVIAVSDDAIAEVAADLARAVPEARAPFVFHPSGRSGAAILDPLRLAGARTAAIHPAMTFAGDPAGEVRRMAGACFAVSGSTPEAVDAARQLVALLGGVAIDIPDALRPLYHAALCHAANHLVTLIAGSFDLLSAAGVAEPGAVLAPLARAALENSLDQGFAALTGPVLRGDAETVAGHLDALAAHRPDVLPAYRAMARATLDRLERDGDRPASAALRGLLD